ncbi:large ribosomal subunit protein mL48 [Amia ocellicauda]|uniref:large ribosomal subunit protein mL48 n=1 Tax=Amia ocellicauda TaxID=2972642 RepID=UPI0034648585
MNPLFSKLGFSVNHAKVFNQVVSVFRLAVANQHPLLGSVLQSNERQYRSMPTHGIGRYKYLLPKQLPKKKRKDKMQIKQINPGTETVYGTLNVLVSGYDMTLVEHYSQYVHNLCNRLKIKVDESYALPTKTTELILVQEQGTKIHVDSVLKTHKRVVQVSDLSSTLAPVFLEVLLRNQPEGVELLVKEHTEEQFQARLKRRPELEGLIAKIS